MYRTVDVRTITFTLEYSKRNLFFVLELSKIVQNNTVLLLYVGSISLTIFLDR